MSTIKHQTSFEVNQPAEVLFPLFSAEGEKLWAPGWDYENVMGGTDLYEDYVFLTSNHHKSEQHENDRHGSGHHGSSHHGSAHRGSDQYGTSKTIWLVKRYEPSNYFIQYYRVEPADKVGIVTVCCKPVTKDLTEVEVAYEYIGLSKKGNDFVAHYSAEAHEEFISHWPQALADYFETISE